MENLRSWVVGKYLEGIGLGLETDKNKALRLLGVLEKSDLIKRVNQGKVMLIPEASLTGALYPFPFSLSEWKAAGPLRAPPPPAPTQWQLCPEIPSPGVVHTVKEDSC